MDLLALSPPPGTEVEAQLRQRITTLTYGGNRPNDHTVASGETCCDEVARAGRTVNKTNDFLSSVAER